MQNLRDKLLKAGLVSADQAAEATTVPRTRPVAPPKSSVPQSRPPVAQPSGPLIAVRREPLV